MVAIYLAKRMKVQSQPDDRVRFPAVIHLQSQVKMRGTTMVTVAAITSSDAESDEELASSASTIFSRDPPAKLERAPISVDTPLSQALEPKVDCRKPFLRHKT